MGLKQQHHLDNPYLSENDRDGQVVIDIDTYLREQRRLA